MKIRNKHKKGGRKKVRWIGDKKDTNQSQERA